MKLEASFSLGASAIGSKMIEGSNETFGAREIVEKKGWRVTGSTDLVVDKISTWLCLLDGVRKIVSTGLA